MQNGWEMDPTGRFLVQTEKNGGLVVRPDGPQGPIKTQRKRRIKKKKTAVMTVII